MVSFLCRSFLSFLSLTLDCLFLSLSLPTHDFPSPPILLIPILKPNDRL